MAISITFTSDTSVDILAELCAFAGMVNAGDVQAQAPSCPGHYSVGLERTTGCSTCLSAVGRDIEFHRS